MTCKWLITMVIVGPLSRVAPFPNGLFMAYKWGLVTNHLLNGMILQVGFFFKKKSCEYSPGNNHIISHLGKMKINDSKVPLRGDMLVPKADI